MVSFCSDPSQVKNHLLRTYIRSEVVVVYKTKAEFGGLSNMASGYPLQVNGTRILTAEALYQACRFPHLPELQREIIGQHSPIIAKRVCQPYRKDSRPDWDHIRHKVMRWCLRVKLAQNYIAFGQLLLSTGDFPIVEQSNRDDYWGAKRVDLLGNTLVGQNVLGRLLMELRQKLKCDEEGALKTVHPLSISEFLLLGAPIDTITGDNQKSQSTLF